MCVSGVPATLNNEEDSQVLLILYGCWLVGM